MTVDGDEVFGEPDAPWPKSLWRSDTAPQHFDPVLDGSAHDVVVVGGGFTGLWTALEVTRLDPTRRVTIVEAAQPGFGASGRNGGWCTSTMPMSLDGLARRHGADAARRLQTEMNRTVAEIGSFVADEGIDCGWVEAGSITVARNEAQLARLVAVRDEHRRHGFGDDDMRLLSRVEVDDRVNVAGALGGAFFAHCATVHPMRLVTGLVDAAVRAGVRIHGNTRVISWTKTHDGHRLVVRTPSGASSVTARQIVRATEGFTPLIAGQRRRLAPVYSYMVATEPLSADAWDEIGWSGRETLTDGRTLVVYAQRTVDGRIAFGGRGAPYNFGSRISPDFDSRGDIHDRVVDAMHEMFPASRAASITHRWGGALGVSRDWHASVAVDPDSGVVSAGGYAGDGVALSRLAGSCAARVVLGIDDDLVRLPIVGHRSPDWEPEPLRWLGINAMLRIADLSDRLENSGSSLARPLASIVSRFTH